MLPLAMRNSRGVLAALSGASVGLAYTQDQNSAQIGSSILPLRNVLQVAHAEAQQAQEKKGALNPNEFKPFKVIGK